jgi:hypothetical protein
MDDDFTGVPTLELLGLRARLAALQFLVTLIALVLALLVATLIQKGVLASWADLIKDVTPGG